MNRSNSPPTLRSSVDAWRAMEPHGVSSTLPTSISRGGSRVGSGLRNLSSKTSRRNLSRSLSNASTIFAKASSARGCTESSRTSSPRATAAAACEKSSSASGAQARRPPTLHSTAAVEARQTLQHVQDILSRMAPKKREVFALHELEGLEHAAIAELVGTSVETVRTRLFHARKDFEKACVKRGVQP